MAQEVQVGLCSLVGLILQVLASLITIQSADALVIFVGNHLRLIVRLPIDFLASDVARLLLQNAGGSYHICNGPMKITKKTKTELL
jgi:hypothetical protein